jgi:hypothetical protein
MAATAILASTGLLLFACDSSDANSLSASTWVLTSAVDHGVPVDIDASGRGIQWRFLDDGGCEGGDPDCPDGPKLIGNDVCNDFTRSVQVDSDLVVWGDYWSSTAVACPGGLSDTLQGFFLDKSFRYVVADGQLRLTSSDGAVELTLRASNVD